MSEYVTIGESKQVSIDDYVVSPQRVCFGTLEANGNFNIYRGEHPSDNNRELLWSTSSSSSLQPGWSTLSMDLRKGPFDQYTKNLQIFATNPKGNEGRGSLQRIWHSGGSTDISSPMSANLGDDGSFILSQNKNIIWKGGVSDPLLVYDLKTIAYDETGIKRTPVGNPNVIEIKRVRNGTTTDQTYAITGSQTVTTASSWTNKLGITVGVKASSKIGIPFVGEASVEVSTSMTNEFTFGESTSTSTTLTIPLSVKVPPGRVVKAWASISRLEFEIPYTMSGVFRFKSGKELTRTIHGVYHGVNGYIAEAGFDDITDQKNSMNLARVKGSELKVQVEYSG